MVEITIFFGLFGVILLDYLIFNIKYLKMHEVFMVGIGFLLSLYASSMDIIKIYVYVLYLLYLVYLTIKVRKIKAK